MSIYQNYEKELFDRIPVSRSLGVAIFELQGQKVILSAPLQENINYAGTAFGGSLNTVAILSCYLMLHHFLKSNKYKFSSLVIQRGACEYKKPTDSDFFASCELPNMEDFKKQLDKKGRGRIYLASNIHLDLKGEATVEFNGRFVVKL